MNEIEPKVTLKNILENFRTKKRPNPDEDMFIHIAEAKKEWEDAKNIFENVSHPELVDYAIYRVEAAEQKYIYLLKQFKNNNLS